MPEEVQRRAGFMLLVILLGSLPLLGQLGNLTVLNRDRLVAYAESQRSEYLRVMAPRGQILDRRGKPLATNRPANVVYIKYPYYKDTAVLTRLSQVLGVPLEDLLDRAEQRQKEGPLWEPVRVLDDITAEQYARMLELRDELPGVTVEVQPVREYPGGELAAHLLGYVGAISEQEWKRLRAQGYRGDDILGKSGLEAFYEPYLRGKDGERRIEVDTAYRPLGEAARTREPVPGNNLNLTIDAELQRAAERALDWTIFRISHSPHTHHPGEQPYVHPARAGAVVVMDVHSGAVLAMASRPAFDPNVFITGRPTGVLERILTDPLAPQWNRAVRASYQPGSTWKMVTATAALMTGVVRPDERILSTSVYEQTKQRESRAGGYGYVDLTRALQVSSNVYFYELGRRLGIDRLVEYARYFGFGARTGVDLAGEADGFLPDAAYRATLKDGWYLGQTTSSAIGQVFAATPLQLARYVAALANGGKVLRPFLVQTITSPAGAVVHETRPEVVGHVPVSPDALRLIQRGMEAVNAPGGTSDFGLFPVPGIKTAGKTGTAQNPGQGDFGLFVSYAPADKPEIAVAVVIENGGHGSWVGPVARAVYAQYFGVELPYNDPARVPERFPAESDAIARQLEWSRGKVWWMPEDVPKPPVRRLGAPGH